MGNLVTTLLKLMFSLLVLVQNNPSLSDVQKQQIIGFANQTIVYVNQNYTLPPNSPPDNNVPPGIVCTMEAKLCPDGKTYVSRIIPTCEFNACPVISKIPQVPNISSISPSTGPKNINITIKGSGFTAANNKISFGDLGSQYNPSYSLNSSDGSTLVFNVPDSNYYACQNSTPRCYIPNYVTQPGVYSVSVINANGTSNSIEFTITNVNVVNAP